jgi:hypothetical protein
MKRRLGAGIAFAVQELRYRLDDPGLKFRQGQAFLFSLKLPDGLWGSPRLVLNG